MRNKIYSQSLLLLLALITCSAARAADWSDFYLGYRFSNQYHDPNMKQNIRKDIFTLAGGASHLYGSHIFNLDILKSDHTEPAANSDRGATDLYFVYRNQLEYGKVFGQPLAFGPVRDMGLSFGFDAETMNTVVAPEKRAFVIGPTLKFDVPGTLDLSLQYYKEKNHNALGTISQDRSFDPTYQINTVWSLPFAAGHLPFIFKGNATYRLSKGDDYNGRPTAAETMLQTSVMADIGSAVGAGKNTLLLGIGFEYGRNKFGNQPSVPGTKTEAVTLQAEYHFSA